MDLVNEASNSGIDDIIVVKATDSILNASLEARLIQDQSTLSATNQQPSGFESTQNVAKNPTQTPSQFSGARFITLYKRISFFFLIAVIPIILLICIILRPNFQSLIHLFLLFYLPFLYPINESSLSNHLKKFILFLMVISCVSLAGQLIFQIVIISSKSDLLPNCSLRQEIFQEFGYARFDKTYMGDIFRVLSPDVILLVGAFITYLINRKYSSCIIEQKRHVLYKYPNQSTKDTTFTDHFCPLKNVNEHEPVTPTTSRHTVDSNKQNLAKQNTKIKRLYKIALSYINQILFMCLLFSCASIWPSLLSIPYFIAFVFLATKWSVTGRLKATRTQFYTKIFFTFYTSLHTLTIYLYQLDLFEQLVEPNTFLARLIGLNQIIQWQCEQPSHIYLNPNLELNQAIQPLLCIFLYWLIVLEFSYGLEKTLPSSPHIAEFSPEINVDKPIESDHQKNNDFDEINEKQIGVYVQETINSDQIDDQNSFLIDLDDKKLIDSEKKLFVADGTESGIQTANLRLKKFSSTTHSVNSNSDVSSNTRRPRDNHKKRRQTAIIFDYTRAYFISVFKFFNKQSYLLSLVSMMAWSILYHSILTLVLLLWACLIWTLPKTRQWCLRSSPLIVAYSISLLILEFIYSLRLNSGELPEFKEIGLEKHETPIIHLAIKAGLTLFFWLTLHQFIAERNEATILNIPTHETNTSQLPFLDQNFQAEIVEWIQSIFAKYWIFLSSLMLLLMSCQNEVVAYRIGYMGLFLYFITTFQLLNTFWRMSLYIFNFIVIIYSMIVLVLIYIFQFDEVPVYFKRVLNIDDEILSSIGFEKFDKTDQLVVRLLTPTTFLIVNIIQNHYFHDSWMKLTNSKRSTDQSVEVVEPTSSINNNDLIVSVLQTNLSDEENKLQRKKENFLSFLKRNINKVNKWYSIVSVYVWRLAEIHVYKALICLIGIYCIKNVSLLNLILFVALLLSILTSHCNQYDKKINSIFSGIVQIWISVLTISSMFFQLKFVHSPMVTNCTFTNRSDSSIDPFLLKPQDNLKYIGIEKADNIQDNLKYYICIFLLLTFQKIVKLKQKHYRLKNNIPQPIYSILFDHITWLDMDKDLFQFSKYMANYFFYRFGLEICLFMTSIVIITRMDVYALVYGIWLGIFLNLRRTAIRRIWIYYFVFLILLLPIQYAGCLGLPSVLCYEYPWSQWNRNQANNIINKARIWLFLPDYSSPPSASKMIADFFQIFFVWLQLNVFNLEMDRHAKISTIMIETMGGKNSELVYEKKDPLQVNPFHDFISKTRNYLDKLKYAIYMYSYWLVLAIVFLSGTSRISILCMGYVILSFIFLWMGQTFLMRPLNKLLKFWNVLVSYCFLVIFIKAVLQIVICIFSSKVSSICLLIDIFGINCKAFPSDKFPETKCLTNDDSGDVGLVWDIVCFLVLLLQRRLYMSNMFEHVVNEYRAQAILAARGAEIFKKIIRHKVKREKDKEDKILEKLKANVERIREHQTDKVAKNPKDHYEAVRSGDYYMFDEELDADECADLNSQASKSKDLDEEFLSSSDSSSNFSKEMKQAILQTAIILDKKENENEKETEQKKSWLTVENKHFLTIKYYFEKYFLIAIDVLIFYLNKQSKDFRLVSHMLAKEKLKLKFNSNSQEPSMQSIDGYLTDQDIQQALKELNQHMNSQSRIDKFLSSIFYFALSQSEFICYFFMILNHLKSASLLSVPLPISIFLWAMLCLPRPTKTFWITSITYIEAIVVIKYLFQFDFFSQDKESLKKLLQVLGIAKINNFAVFDLFCLLVIFLHRTILKRLGLWKDYSSDEDDDEMITIKNKEINAESNLDEETDEILQIEPSEVVDEPGLVEEENANDYDDAENADESGLKRLKNKAEQISKEKTTNPFLKFYRDIQSKHYAVVVDCYAKTFLCEFINCIITIFTYQYFGESAYLAAEDSSNSVVSSIKDNKVPYSFLVMFLIQFILMIVDRALYLRKNRVGKFLFQLALVLFVHIWVFFVLPYITKLPFTANRPVQIWYLVKCIYFGYSSRQIRCGYPTRILGNFLTKSYSYVNLVLFKGFLLVPFLLELRSLMDWMFTDTSLSLSDWLQMEDIYANIFVLKCFRYNENKYPTPRGTKRKATIKYGFGGLLLTIIILIIWFPLLLFSVSKDFNESIPPQTCKVDLQIAGFLQIYSMSSQQRLAQKLSLSDFNSLKNIDSGSYSFLKDYTPDDVFCIAIPGNSTSIWQISPPSFENLKEQLIESDPVELNFFYSITRVSTGLKNEQISEVVSASKQSKLYNETKMELYKMLNNENSAKSVKLESVYPRFVHARTKGNIVEIDSMKNSEKLKYYVDIQIKLRNQSNNLWWDALEIPTKNYTPPCSKSGYLSIVVISDQVSPSSISFITEQGIIGIYITFVLALSRFIRIMVVNSSMKIIFEQLPNVDRILKLVRSVYMVRENKQFLLEEELYAKIIFLYRSPETMIKYTRPPKNLQNRTSGDQEAIDNDDKKNK